MLTKDHIKNYIFRLEILSQNAIHIAKKIIEITNEENEIIKESIEEINSSYDFMLLLLQYIDGLINYDDMISVLLQCTECTIDTYDCIYILCLQINNQELKNNIVQMRTILFEFISMINIYSTKIYLEPNIQHDNYLCKLDQIIDRVENDISVVLEIMNNHS